MPFDKTRANQLSTFVSSVAIGTSYQTILNINGSGYMDTIMFAATTSVLSVRITVDGIVKFEGTGNAARLVGIVTRNLLRVQNGGTVMGILDTTNPNQYNAATINTNIFGFPYTLNALNAGTVSIMTDSLYFNSNLLVEAKFGVGASTSYYVSGGYR